MGIAESTSAAGFLVPSDPLRDIRVDPYFAREARTARELDAVTVRIDHDAVVRGDIDAALRGVRETEGFLVYRGWMIPSQRYAEMETGLSARGVRLLTSARNYQRGHEFPYWYAHFAAHTPASVWLPGMQAPSAAALATAVAQLPAGPGIVKDWVKSRKHEWDSACFAPDLADTARLTTVVHTFAERQGEFLAGGIVVRAFEEFTGAEARVWWVHGEPVLVTAHPDTPERTPDPPIAEFAETVRAFDAPFLTTDLAQRTDGRWRIIEVGDGQVSDLPADAEPLALLRALLGRQELS